LSANKAGSDFSGGEKEKGEKEKEGGRRSFTRVFAIPSSSPKGRRYPHPLIAFRFDARKEGGRKGKGGGGIFTISLAVVGAIYLAVTTNALGPCWRGKKREERTPLKRYTPQLIFSLRLLSTKEKRREGGKTRLQFFSAWGVIVFLAVSRRKEERGGAFETSTEEKGKKKGFTFSPVPPSRELFHPGTREGGPEKKERKNNNGD